MSAHDPYDPPERPYPGLLADQFAQIERDLAEQPPLGSPHEGASASLREALSERVQALSDDLVELSHTIHANPEVGYEEHKSAATAAALLERHGHTVEVGAYGLPTAFRARVGTGRPRVAVLAEYDALPGIGHACGHNVICATALGAFLALSSEIDALGGSVELIGTPAEEGGGGKEHIARAGGFDDVDAAVMVHPMGVDIADHPWIGVRQVSIVYHGISAHASVMPFLGRNALDAVVHAYNGMSQLRQHMLPTDRVHGVITDGGQRPNIVPDRAAATFYLRSAQPHTLSVLADQARRVFEAAALATGTQLETLWDPCPVYLPVRHNTTLAGRYAANMGLRGRRVLPAGVMPEEMTGSTDLGNVSVRVPAIHPTLAIAPPDVTIHTPEFATWASSERADEGLLDGAAGLALTAADFLADRALREAVEAEFASQGGPLDVDALLE